MPLRLHDYSFLEFGTHAFLHSERERERGDEDQKHLLHLSFHHYYTRFVPFLFASIILHLLMYGFDVNFNSKFKVLSSYMFINLVSEWVNVGGKINIYEFKRYFEFEFYLKIKKICYYYNKRDKTYKFYFFMRNFLRNFNQSKKLVY